MSVNLAFLVGRLGKDPELRSTKGGTSVATFSVATESSWRDKSGERKKQTEWHNIVAFGPRGDACAKYLAKGSLVHIEGESPTPAGATRPRTTTSRSDQAATTGGQRWKMQRLDTRS